MQISYNWIQKYFKQQLPAPTELAALLNIRAFEVEGLEEKNGDSIFEIKITPDRASDCLSHFGVAKEISVHARIPLENTIEIKQIADDFETTYTVDAQDKKVKRYMLREIKDVVVKESPLELKLKLESIGQRSINTIVDITNLVMYEIGQPMHAFDSQKIDGTTITIGVPSQLQITTLDSKIVELTEDDTVIKDQSGNLAIAGVKGGKKAEVNSETKNIILESANFPAIMVRKTSKRTGIQTDSSKRFENGITPVLAQKGIDLASEYLKEYASDESTQFSNIVDFYPRPASPYYTGVSLKEINKKLGTELTQSEVEEIFDLLGFEYSYINTKSFVLEEIKKHIGTPHNIFPSLTYDAPHSFDCTTLTAYVFAHGGKSIPRLSIDQLFFGTEITKEELEPGDLVFSTQDSGVIRYETVGFLPGLKFEEGVDHVGMYIGEDKVIHSSRYNEKVAQEKLSESSNFKHIVGYRRIVDVDEMRFAVRVPDERLDIKAGINLIEEIGRVYGYEHIVPAAPVKIIQTAQISTYEKINTIKSHLIDLGFDEVVTYSFQKKGDISVVKPLAKDKGYLRTNLTKGLQDSLDLNFKNKELFATDLIKIFEIGKVFAEEEERLCLGLGVKSAHKKIKAKTILEEAISYLKEKTGISFDVHVEDDAESLEIELTTQLEEIREEYNSLHTLSPQVYIPFSAYPFITRDVAVWSSIEDSQKEIESTILNLGGELLLRYDLFDTFSKEGKTSYAYRLIFQSHKKTLTDDEVNQIMDTIYSKLQSNVGFEIR